MEDPRIMLVLKTRRAKTFLKKAFRAKQTVLVDNEAISAELKARVHPSLNSERPVEGRLVPVRLSTLKKMRA